MADAHCHSKEGEAKLRSTIESEGAPDFNQMGMTCGPRSGEAIGA